MRLQQRVLASLALALAPACAATAPAAPPPDPVEAVYHAVLASGRFGAFCELWLFDEHPHLDERLLADVGVLGRWHVDNFEEWLQLTRLPAEPGPADQPLRLPEAVLAAHPGQGHSGVRFSRVGFDPAGTRACVLFLGGRLGTFYVAARLDLAAAGEGWEVQRVEPTWFSFLR